MPSIGVTVWSSEMCQCSTKIGIRERTSSKTKFVCKPGTLASSKSSRLAMNLIVTEQICRHETVLRKRWVSVGYPIAGCSLSSLVDFKDGHCSCCGKQT